ncbi:MAG: IS3 family transposase, partial [Burkholderiales bacterium]|nr:IS3 family transposase [Burkholderiales bacterium]
MTFIQAHRSRWGVEPICRVLQVAPSSSYAAIRRPPSARTQRDADLAVAIRQVWDQERQVYGADKVWNHLNQDGVRVARCTVERLMRAAGLRGVVRGQCRVRTTQAADGDARPADLVARQFHADAPNRLWVADLTYVRTQTGWV